MWVSTEPKNGERLQVSNGGVECTPGREVTDRNSTKKSRGFSYVDKKLFVRRTHQFEILKELISAWGRKIAL